MMRDMMRRDVMIRDVMIRDVVGRVNEPTTIHVFAAD
jgi:hypothetical protein